MPSKLTAILSIGGVAIVTAQKGTSLHEVVYSAKAGILIEPEDQVALNMAIEEAIFSGNEAIALNARIFAEKNLAIDEILSNFKTTVLNGETPKKRFGKEMMAKMA
jgi:colanic acid biosynthesis glycosyl transferase WcaI